MGVLSAIVAAHGATSFEWNGRPFVRLTANIARGPNDQTQINEFYRRSEEALRPLGFTHWSAAAVCKGGGTPDWTVSIALVGPGEWTDETKLPRSD